MARNEYSYCSKRNGRHVSYIIYCQSLFPFRHFLSYPNSAIHSAFTRYGNLTMTNTFFSCSDCSNRSELIFPPLRATNTSISILQLHGIMFKHVRGNNFGGHFKNVQNYIQGIDGVGNAYMAFTVICIHICDRIWLRHHILNRSLDK